MILSIIIPVYNAEAYLDACIQSIINQTFVDFELVLVDDGSTDLSGMICDKYATKDLRIKVFHKKNGGVSSARNFGIEQASGNWITFVDSDDRVGENYLNVLEKNWGQADCIFVGIDQIAYNGQIKEIRFEEAPISTLMFFEKYTLFPHFSGPYGKFYNSEIIKKRNVRFDERLHNGEDGLFNFQYLFKTKLIAFHNESVYYYQKREDSLSRRELHIEDTSLLFHSLLNVMEAHHLDEKIISRNLGYVVSLYFFSILNSRLKFKQKKNILIKLSGRFKDRIIQYLQGTKYTRFLGFLVDKNQYSLIVLISSLRSKFK
ncbi:glycosyltransferase [Sphingobacterium sp. SGG-5]|uniref:glycosyltransferase family 2 protein n=1 Tax=Sphingobacterium sp. SGG-5 TaxID=2710881 RepID=UPI0013EB30D8|nr:glycosyltransferase family 2 protein [Sphingobacterium sp. SGG-5]NGM63426.1 glycosyltransferase [Sphingobacterium sp. SGG-5]